MIFGEEACSDCLIVNDLGTALWVPSRYLDTFRQGQLWSFSSDWGAVSERADRGSWWGFVVARRELLPHVELLIDGVSLRDHERVELIASALYPETARDNLIYWLALFAAGEVTVLEISQWALRQLEEETPVTRNYSATQIEIIAELSTLEEDPADVAVFADALLSRL